MYTYEIYDEKCARVLRPDGTVYEDAGLFYELEGAIMWAEYICSVLNSQEPIEQ